MSVETEDKLTIKQHLQDIRCDLQNVEVEGLVGNLFLGWWLHPLKFAADPLLGVAETVVPAVTSVVPFSEPAVGLALNASSIAGHFLYDCGSRVGVLGERNVDEDANSEIEKFLYGGTSLFKTALGFGTGVATDISTALVSEEKMSSWLRTGTAVKTYLVKSGIGAELLDEVPELVPNLILLNRLQALERSATPVASRRVPTNENLEEGKHFMKYATAAYGMATIEAAQDEGKAAGLGKQEEENILQALNSLSNGQQCLDQDSVKEMYTIDNPFEAATVKKIKAHLREGPDDAEDDIDIIAMFVKPGGDFSVLRHFVAVDHDKRSVVLAIRGTFSVTGMLIDAKLYSDKFCGGQCHSGIGEQAGNLWKLVGGIVRRALDDNPGYDLVITGHSLGAGTASLLTIKCYHESLVKSKVRCFAFASPPVYTPLSNAPLAVANTINYIHDDDCVSFLSAHNVRELAEYLKSVGEVNMDLVTRTAIILGKKEPIPGLVAAYEKAKNASLPHVSGAPKLLVPASDVVWMRGDVKHGYKAFTVRPEDLPDIYADVDMINDHFPPKYEAAFGLLSPANVPPSQ